MSAQLQSRGLDHAVVLLALLIVAQLLGGAALVRESARADSGPPAVAPDMLPAVTPDESAVALRPAPPPDPDPEPFDPDLALFARTFPAQAAARQVPGDPATAHWALIVGVNAYQGRTGNTLGSVADAQSLRQALLDRGWRDEHILVMLDGQATHDWIVRGLQWLERKTDATSTVVFSKSGHMRHSGGVSALWPADNKFIWAGDFGRMIGAVEAERMWVSLQGCHAEGMRAEGLEGPGRVVTYSSKTAEKSYEDPEVGHSVAGNYLFAEGLHTSWGDADGDGKVSVQEAFAWAAPRAHTRTSGWQTPVIADGLGEPFHLEVAAQRRQPLLSPV